MNLYALKIKYAIKRSKKHSSWKAFGDNEMSFMISLSQSDGTAIRYDRERSGRCRTNGSVEVRILTTCLGEHIKPLVLQMIYFE